MALCVERRWGMMRDWLNYCRKKTRVISHPIISPFTPILCQERSISPHLFHLVCMCVCVCVFKERKSIQTKVLVERYCIRNFTAVSFLRAGQSVVDSFWMQLTFQKYTLNGSKTFWWISFALQSVMHHNTSHQGFKDMYASEESRRAGISFESSAVAFFSKPSNPMLNRSTDKTDYELRISQTHEIYIYIYIYIFF